MTPPKPISGAEEITIRDLRLDDYEAVTQLWTEAGLPFRPQGRDSVVKIAMELTGGNAVFLVAEAGGVLVGVVFGTHDGRKGWINRLAVTQSHRRRGIAARLVDQVETRLAAVGIDVVAAIIETHNRESLAFFRRVGYVHDPEIEYVSKRANPES
jgi:ribosomal protein S18 acetylase RimI-like enzyme